MRELEQENKMPRYHGVDACSKITKEQYMFEGEIYTKNQIQKLTNSQEYKNARKLKGDKVENWNWQVHATLNGSQNLIDKADDEFNLIQELEMVD